MESRRCILRRVKGERSVAHSAAPGVAWHTYRVYDGAVNALLAEVHG